MTVSLHRQEFTESTGYRIRSTVSKFQRHTKLVWINLVAKAFYDTESDNDTVQCSDFCTIGSLGGLVFEVEISTFLLILQTDCNHYLFKKAWLEINQNFEEKKLEFILNVLKLLLNGCHYSTKKGRLGIEQYCVKTSGVGPPHPYIFFLT